MKFISLLSIHKLEGFPWRDGQKKAIPLKNTVLKFIPICSSLKVMSKNVIIFVNITWISIFIIARRKSDANMFRKTNVKFYFCFNRKISKYFKDICIQKYSKVQVWVWIFNFFSLSILQILIKTILNKKILNKKIFWIRKIIFWVIKV